MPKFILLANTIATCLLLSQPVNAETQSYAELAKAIEADHSSRLQYFMNGHFVWINTTIEKETDSGTRYEYWARDGQYFRVDKQDIVNGMPTGPVRRIIVRPEGYGRFVSTDTDNLGAIVDIGTADDGKQMVSIMEFIAKSNRIGVQPVKNYFAAWPKREMDLVGLELVDEEDGGVFLLITRRVDGHTRVLNTRLSADDYRVLHYTYRFDSEDGTQWATNDATYTYHPTVPDLVKSVKIVGESNFDPPFESTFELLEHDPSPAPLAVFDVGLPSAPQGWSRRLVLLAAGVAMIAAWLLWRKKQTAHP